LAAERPDSDRAAPLHSSERASEVRVDNEDEHGGGRLPPAVSRALGNANAAIAQHRATKNPLFLWEAIEAITSPAMVGQPLVLGEEVRGYLHAAAEGIVTAGLSPVERFKDSVLKALLFSDTTNGSSVPKEFSRLQSASAFLGIYLALRDQIKSDAAQKLMASELGTTQPRIKARITEARTELRAMMRANGETIPPDDELGNPSMRGMPQPVLLQMLRGLPNVMWTVLRREGARKVN
jgi:hypothetical protein